MKKGDFSDFLGIILLVIVLVLILVFNRMRSIGSNMMQTDSSIKDTQNIFYSNAAVKFLYVTEKGITNAELLGSYACYGERIISYGPYLGDIDAVNAVKNTLDNMIGKDAWKLEIALGTNNVCFMSDGVISEGSCTSFGKDYVSYFFIFPLPCKREFGSGKIIIEG
jgi:hypothetical protein